MSVKQREFSRNGRWSDYSVDDGWSINYRFGGLGSCVFLDAQVHSAKKARVQRKCAGTEHRRSRADRCEQDRNRWVAKMSRCDPKLDHRDQRSHKRRPESNQEEHSSASTNDVWNHRRGER